MNVPIRLAIVGAGIRGTTYAQYARLFPQQATVTAVAEPRPQHRAALADQYQIPAERRFADWRELAAQPRMADAVVITTPDSEHAAPAIAFAEQGYDLLLEKPIAPDESACAAVIEAARRTGVLLAVCHVLRYTPYTALVKEVIDSGRLGDLVGIQHLEPVGWWHFAHSYVRGNWRRADESSSSLLAKCCHDLDWLRYLVGRAPVRVSSVGGLHHFHAGNRPAGAADRCLDCAVEPDCPYSAPRLYRSCLGDPLRERWPLSVLTLEPDGASLERALREGPYGRCVYACDNDVADHQNVTVQFEGGVSATLTMSAFTPMSQRLTRVMGTRGYLDGDGERITVTDFVTGRTETSQVGLAGADAASGHGGGDLGLMTAFVEAVATGDHSRVRSGPAESWDSHRMVFAAERSRHHGGVPVEL